MGEAQKTVRIDIEPGAWNEFARYLLTPAADAKMPGPLLDHWQDEVAAERLHLFWIKVDGLPRAAVLLRIDHLPGGPEGVIVAAGGEAVEGVRLVKLLPQFERQFIGIKRVRIHTARRGLVKFLAGAGYKLQEFVLMKEVA